MYEIKGVTEIKTSINDIDVHIKRRYIADFLNQS